MASIKDIVFDSPHPASAARFWAQALDGCGSIRSAPGFTPVMKRI
ncbi:hypothetical protein [Streptomyces spinosirectus]